MSEDNRDPVRAAEREAFENAFRPLQTNWTFEDDGTGGYHHMSTDWAWQGWQARAAISTPNGWVTVPVEPSTGLLVSMAIRADHALGVPGYYDQPLMQRLNGVGHARMLESTMQTMRQLHEEVVGTGFYRSEKETEYAKQADPPKEPPPIKESM